MNGNSERKDQKAEERNAQGDSHVLSQNDVEEEVQKLLDSGKWKIMKHEATGKTYYYDVKTRQTCWDLRKELLKQRKAPVGTSGAVNSHTKVEVTSDTLSEGNTNAMKEPFKSEKRNTVNTGEKRDEGEMYTSEVSGMEKELAPAKGFATSDSVKVENDMNDRNANEEQGTLVSFIDKGKDLVNPDVYKDPLERLMSETNRLEHLMASPGTSQAMALEFQRSFEALARTNKALAAQMAKMKQEYDAMDMALRDANKKVYEKDLALREAQSHTRVVNKEEEAVRTLAFLREQNQELVRQVGELTVTLSRGFNETAYQQALSSCAGSINPEAMAANPRELRAPHQQSLGATLDSLMANPVAQKCLCGTCGEKLERLRLSLLPKGERATVRGSEKSHGNGAAGAHHAQYTIAGATATPFDRCGHPVELFHPQQKQHSMQGYPARDFGNEEYGSGRGHPLRQQEQQQQRGIAPVYPDWYAPKTPVITETYGDYLAEKTLDRRSLPRVSPLIASPVFGGFRIRPAY